MDNHTVLADVSNCLLNLLKEHCVPDPIGSADKIGFSSQIGAADFALSLALYDIKPMDRGLFPENVFPLCLKYILIAESQAVPQIKADQEARILGRAIWTFANYSLIDKSFLNNQGFAVSIFMDAISLDEKTRIVNSSDGMKPAVFYCVSPVLMSLEGGVVAARVRSAR